MDQVEDYEIEFGDDLDNLALVVQEEIVNTGKLQRNFHIGNYDFDFIVRDIEATLGLIPTGKIDELVKNFKSKYYSIECSQFHHPNICLIGAAQYNHPHILNEAIINGANDFNSALLVAAENGNLQIIMTLFQRFDLENKPLVELEEPIRVAQLKGYFNIVDYLKDKRLLRKLKMNY